MSGSIERLTMGSWPMPSCFWLPKVVNALSKLRGTSFDEAATGFTFSRAALIDPPPKARLAEIYRRLEGAGCDWSCAYRKLCPAVLMVQATEDRCR